MIGVGRGGIEAVNYMIQSGIDPDDCISCHYTDVLSRLKACASKTIALRPFTGLCGGNRSFVNHVDEAVREQYKEISCVLRDTDVVFIVTCMGGHVGTVASPFIAEIAKKQGITTVTVATKPFAFEGLQRMKIAEEGFIKLGKFSDEMEVVVFDRNHNRDDFADIGIKEAFAIGYDELYQYVKCFLEDNIH